MGFVKIDTAENNVDTVTQTVFAMSNTSVTILAANPERKYAYFFNQNLVSGNQSNQVFLHFAATPATTSNGVGIKEGQGYEFPKNFVYTGEIRAIAGVAGPIPLYVEEWT